MICAKNISKPDFIFSQYSRKGYSIFSSLGIIIKIGTLAVELCNHGFTKCKQFIDSLTLQLNASELKEEMDHDDFDLRNEEFRIISISADERFSCGLSNKVSKLINAPVIYLPEMTGFFMSNN